MSNKYNRPYPKAVIDLIKVKCESIGNNMVVARQVVNETGMDVALDTMRKMVAKIRKNSGLNPDKIKVKRLFYDIETGYYKTSVFAPWKQFIRPESLEGEKKIICICYKWQGEDTIHTLKWDSKQDDKALVEKFIKIIAKADEIVAHNGDRFDIKELRTRALMNGTMMFPKYRSIDTLQKSRKFFRFPSNSLKYLGIKLNVSRKLDHVGFDLWRRCQEGWSNDDESINLSPKKKIKEDALQEMVEYCKQDVVVLEDLFTVIMPWIDHNTNYSVLNGGSKWGCPECASENVQLSHTDTTPMGYIKRHMKCSSCNKAYHVSNRSFQQFLTKHIGNS